MAEARQTVRVGSLEVCQRERQARGAVLGGPHLAVEGKYERGIVALHEGVRPSGWWRRVRGVGGARASWRGGGRPLSTPSSRVLWGAAALEAARRRQEEEECVRAEMERRNAEAEAREANLAHLAALAALAAAKAAVTTWSKVREVEWGSAQACVGEGWRTA